MNEMLDTKPRVLDLKPRRDQASKPAELDTRINPVI
jgi:hypothetical protein